MSRPPWVPTVGSLSTPGSYSVGTKRKKRLK
jgi:hypothetical protein